MDRGEENGLEIGDQVENGLSPVLRKAAMARQFQDIYSVGNQSSAEKRHYEKLFEKEKRVKQMVAKKAETSKVMGSGLPNEVQNGDAGESGGEIGGADRPKKVCSDLASSSGDSGVDSKFFLTPFTAIALSASCRKRISWQCVPTIRFRTPCRSTRSSRQNRPASRPG